MGGRAQLTSLAAENNAGEFGLKKSRLLDQLRILYRNLVFLFRQLGVERLEAPICVAENRFPLYA